MVTEVRAPAGAVEVSAEGGKGRDRVERKKAPPRAEGREERGPGREPTGPAQTLAGNRVRFQVDRDSGETVLLFLDEAGEVVRQFPPREALATSRRLGALAGMLFERTG